MKASLVALSLEWTNHLNTPEKKQEFEKSLRNDVLVMTRLKGILDKHLEVIKEKEASLSSYDSPSWPYLQAHLNGKKDEIQKLLQLLNFLKDH